jgi:phosphoribosylformylglycinamidine synthase
VSGNVSLYNETAGRGIPPTPTIGGVGLLDDVARHATIAFKREATRSSSSGTRRAWLGQSLYLARSAAARRARPLPSTSSPSAATAISCAG